jgi:signal transduction histidine kinase
MLLQTVLDTLPTGIQVLRAIRNEQQAVTDFEYILINEAAKEYTQPDQTFLNDGPDKRDLFDHLVVGLNNSSDDGPGYSFVPDGVTPWLRIRYAKFGDGVLLAIEEIEKVRDGLATKSIEAGRGISLQEKLEEKIKLLNESLSSKNRELATANLELQTFSSIAANDFKETLKHLYTNLEFITSVEAQNLSNAGRANIRRAQSAIQKMKLLTEDIIVYSDIQHVDESKTTVAVNGIMDSIKTYMLRKMKEEDIQIDCDDMPSLKGYPALLSLLFHHLIDNAIKFHQGEQKIIIHIKCEEQEGRLIKNRSANPGKRYYLVSITDNGHGFSAEHAEEIFNMFYRIPGTYNNKGSGMGLAICKKIMDIHGGFILAESIEGNGASFTCYFLKDTD